MACRNSGNASGWGSARGGVKEAKDLARACLDLDRKFGVSKDLGRVLWRGFMLRNEGA